MSKMLLSYLLAILVVVCSTVQALPIVDALAGTHQGDGTFFQVGLGSCGVQSKNSDMVVALSASLMQSGNYCGKKIKVKTQTGTVTATVVDTCPSCGKWDIDFSEGAFAKIGSLAAGRIPISWKFAS